jgi:hypothetical protein
MVFVVPAVQRPRYCNQDAFANSIIVEDQSAFFEDDSPISTDLRLDLFELTVSLSYRVAWEQGDILMIDNSRVMHGRTKIRPDHDRRIVVRMGQEVP